MSSDSFLPVIEVPVTISDWIQTTPDEPPPADAPLEYPMLNAVHKLYTIIRNNNLFFFDPEILKAFGSDGILLIKMICLAESGTAPVKYTLSEQSFANRTNTFQTTIDTCRADLVQVMRDTMNTSVSDSDLHKPIQRVLSAIRTVDIDSYLKEGIGTNLFTDLKSFADESTKYSSEELLIIYDYMVAIRTVCSMLVAVFFTLLAPVCAWALYFAMTVEKTCATKAKNRVFHCLEESVVGKPADQTYTPALLRRIYTVTATALDSSHTMYFEGWCRIGKLFKGRKPKDTTLFDNFSCVGLQVESNMVGEQDEYSQALTNYCAHMNSITSLGTCIVRAFKTTELTKEVEALFQRGGTRGLMGFGMLAYSMSHLFQEYIALIDRLHKGVISLSKLNQYEYNRQQNKMIPEIRAIIEQKVPPELLSTGGGRRKRKTCRCRRRRFKRKTRRV